MKALAELSPNAKVFILINKIDKIDEDNRNMLLMSKKEKFESKGGKFIINIYETSIWENSLYKIFSNILSSIIIKCNDKIKKILEEYTNACEADEIVLFDRKTLLNICSFNKKEIKDGERFEKICYSLKKFESNYKFVSNKINDFIIKSKINTIYFNVLNNNIYIMVVLSKKDISLELVKLNMEMVKKQLVDIMNE